MAVHYLGDNGGDGVVMGTGTSEKIGFHGATPIVQATVTALATAAGTATIVAKVQAIQAALENLGLIADG